MFGSLPLPYMTNKSTNFYKSTYADKRRRTFNHDIKGESITGVLNLLLRKALCSYHVLNFRMPEGLRSYKLCSYKKKTCILYLNTKP